MVSEPVGHGPAAHRRGEQDRWLAQEAAGLPQGRANMAYKDILVYLDPTVETVERIRLAVSLAKAHGARLIGVDVSAPSAGQEAETEDAVSRTFSDTTRESGLTTVFAPVDQAGRSRQFHPLRRPDDRARARKSGPRGHTPRRARPGVARIRRADADAAAGMDAQARSETTSSSRGTPGVRLCAPSMTRCRCSNGRRK